MLIEVRVRSGKRGYSYRNFDIWIARILWYDDKIYSILQTDGTIINYWNIVLDNFTAKITNYIFYYKVYKHFSKQIKILQNP